MSQSRFSVSTSGQEPVECDFNEVVRMLSHQAWVQPHALDAKFTLWLRNAPVSAKNTIWISDQVFTVERIS